MKGLIVSVLLVTLATVALSDMKAELEQIGKTCMAESKATEAEMRAFMAVAGDAQMPAASDNLKCNMKCVMEKLGAFKAGALVPDVMMKHMKEMPQNKDKAAEVDAAINKCKAEKGANDCDTAFKIATCLKKGKQAFASA